MQMLIKRLTRSEGHLGTSTSHRNLLYEVKPASNSKPLTFVPKLLRILHQAGKHKTNRKPYLA
jgi:hypothetical protein